jgi:hypothetical protein
VQRINLEYRPKAPGWCPPRPETYAYLLGIYLGDGCLTYRPPHSFLQVALDSLYPAIIEEVAAAIADLVPGISVRIYPDRVQRRTTVQASYAYWPEVFPQHGPGRKHTRPIVLRDWQHGWVRRAPGQFLRGLIHSDGCRTVNRFKTKLPSGRVAEYAYPRYFFSNESAEIRGLFCQYCELLGIRWTQSNRRNISVSHRASVAKLDSFVGPKSGGRQPCPNSK